MCLCVCIGAVAHRGQSGGLQVKLYYVGLGNQTLVLCKNSMCSQLLSHLFSPKYPYFKSIELNGGMEVYKV